MHTQITARVRVAVIAAVFAIAGGVAGCKDFLKTTNPTAIDPKTLVDTGFIPLMVYGAIGEFQSSYPTAVYYEAVFTDELRNTHVFSEEVAYDRRDVDSLNGTFSVYQYAPVQRARWLADSAGGRLAALEGDSAKRDLRYARALAYAGYGLIALADMECGTPVYTPQQPYGKALASDQVYAMAIARFDTAITVAKAAKAAALASSTTATTATKAIIAGADSIVDLANVGAARAALNIGDKTKAIAYATAVTPIGADFQFRIYFVNNTSFSQVYNPIRDRLSGGGGVTSGAISGTPFEGIDDARVPYPRDTTGKGVAESTMSGSWIVPNSPSAFSTFDGTKVGVDFDYGGWMRLASLLEAKYIIAEANASAPTSADIAFVESRRLAYPSSTASAVTTAANFLDNLIDQRRRDFYLDGHRIADLRRYQKLYNRDYWQHGAVPGQTGQVFTDRTCFPLNLAEYQNNPALVP